MSASLMQDKQNKLDEYFKSNIRNMIKQAESGHGSRFSTFLDERQQLFALEAAKRDHFVFFSLNGGYENCDRKLFAAFCDEKEMLDADFPITALKLEFSGKAKLSHRDFLGSLMGLQIKREAVGDIVVEEGFAIAFLHRDVSAFVLQSLDKVGNVNVVVKELSSDEAPIEGKQEMKELCGTVSSLRLDCIVAFILNVSRSIAAQKISSGLVKINHVQTDNISKQLKGLDVISISGKGRFVLSNEIKTTKKDRYFIKIDQFI